MQATGRATFSSPFPKVKLAIILKPETEDYRLPCGTGTGRVFGRIFYSVDDKMVTFIFPRKVWTPIAITGLASFPSSSANSTLIWETPMVCQDHIPPLPPPCLACTSKPKPQQLLPRQEA